MASDSYPQSHGSLVGLTSTDHHTQYALPSSGPASSRPNGPWRFGRIYYSNDTGDLSFDQGAGWIGFGGSVKLNLAQTWTATQTFSTLTTTGQTLLNDDTRVGSANGSAGFALALNQIMSS